MELQDTGWSYRIQDTVVGYRIELQDTGQSCIIQDTVVGYMTVLQDTAWDGVTRCSRIEFQFTVVQSCRIHLVGRIQERVTEHRIELEASSSRKAQYIVTGYSIKFIVYNLQKDTVKSSRLQDRVRRQFQQQGTVNSYRIQYKSYRFQLVEGYRKVKCSIIHQDGVTGQSQLQDTGYRIGWSYRILDRVVRYSSKYIIYILGRIELVVGYRTELKDTISRIQDAELLRRL